MPTPTPRRHPSQPGWTPSPGFDPPRPTPDIVMVSSDPVLDTESRVWFNGCGPSRRRTRKETKMNRIDQVALDVIDAIGNEGGEFGCEPGQVLFDLASATGHEYKSVSLAVLYLERMEMVEVDRYDEPQARKANRLVRIRLI